VAQVVVLLAQQASLLSPVARERQRKRKRREQAQRRDSIF